MTPDLNSVVNDIDNEYDDHPDIDHIGFRYVTFLRA